MTHYQKRIIIVEDNRIDVKLLKDILEKYGHVTVQTGDGLEVISLALAHRPDLILMDLRLPQISGLEVTRRLRGDDRSRQIPIIAVTAVATNWHEHKALDSGCDAFISKPISIVGLLSTIEPFLSRSPNNSARLFPEARQHVDGRLALCAQPPPFGFEQRPSLSDLGFRGGR
jgi:two-component system cell cycle response regulator DivK